MYDVEDGAPISMRPPPRLDALAWMKLGGSAVAVAARWIERVAEADEAVGTVLDLVRYLGLGRPEGDDRRALQVMGAGGPVWLVVGPDIEMLASEQVKRQELPGLVAAHLLALGVDALLVRGEEGVALLLDPRGLPTAAFDEVQGALP